MSLNLHQKLTPFKDAQKIPHVLLFTGVNEDKTQEVLSEAAVFLEGKEVSEAKGNKIFLESENDSTIKVDEVRNLLKKMSLRNWEEGAARYILIPRAERLTSQSSNALLKSLEEAPEGTYFLMCAPSRKSLLKTILSRSFVVYLNEDDESVDSESGRAFKAAFFEKDYEPMAQVSKADLKKEWEDFNKTVKDTFVEKVYTGELNNAEWYRLFNFMSEIDQKISANMDTKWLTSSIERFGFNG